jgi:hypothetical protein
MYPAVLISITYRNIQVDSIETLDQSMNSIKLRGFINYYGNALELQRE